MVAGFVAFVLLFGAGYLVWRTIVHDKRNM